MSEYQYYEFRAVDRPLSPRAMRELRELSSRAEITPRRFVNVYNYGDFRGDPEQVLDRYFDAFLYVANWGTRRLMFRLPRGLADVDAMRPYAAEESVSVTETAEHVLVELLSQEETGGEWEEGEGWLGRLIDLRADLLAGDLRSLYVGWLVWCQFADPDEDGATTEPPVPPGLRNLSKPLRRLVKFLRVDRALLDVAARASAEDVPAGPSRDDLAGWLAARPPAQKDAWLLSVAAGEASPRPEILRQFREDRAKARPKGAPAAPPGRTVAELLEAREGAAEERRRRKEAKNQRERAAHLEGVKAREGDLWREVDKVLASKGWGEYDRVVGMLKDLRDLAEHEGRLDEALARIRALRDRYHSRKALLDRMDRAGLKG